VGARIRKGSFGGKDRAIKFGKDKITFRFRKKRKEIRRSEGNEGMKGRKKVI